MNSFCWIWCAGRGFARFFGEHNAPPGIVTGFIFVGLQDGELDPVEGGEFFDGEAEFQGVQGVNLDECLPPRIIGAERAVPGPGRLQSAKLLCIQPRILPGPGKRLTLCHFRGAGIS